MVVALLAGWGWGDFGLIVSSNRRDAIAQHAVLDLAGGRARHLAFADEQIADRPMPGIVLEDGSIVALSWPQSFALRAALNEFRRVVVPAERDAYGPARACILLPT